ncbi:hypothetical protein BO86DRAFT_191667 [Aspergillus japonicus CBS 114.51]|uniref:Uncharacterized protein n=1 Tax=Aspergillus japonicus CBS 114.51 TaxID=1448312 RepID=A0A8T8XDQ1_ASPJA|nr:hypothetical protein BO86DRAFT_191667 [Aspergillus japonicus CBS 114.51]RAH85482.1 hypothetical protein BO86DRAFT_191667 [Aspergillus japonicus CBS 114.51]
MGLCGLTPDYESWVESRNGRLRSLRRQQDPTATRILLPPGYVIHRVREAEDSSSHSSLQEQGWNLSIDEEEPSSDLLNIPGASDPARAKTNPHIEIQKSPRPDERHEEAVPKTQPECRLQAPRILTLERLPNGLYKARRPHHSNESSIIDLRASRNLKNPTALPSYRDKSTWTGPNRRDVIVISSSHSRQPSSKTSSRRSGQAGRGTPVESPRRVRFYRTADDDNVQDNETVNGKVSSWLLQDDEFW